jgi:WD40 repeat protein
LAETRIGPASLHSDSGGHQTQRYDAFISYSHAADGRLAPAIQRGLQSLAKPWYRRRALRVFRDETSLSATPELWTTIMQALEGSRFFLLLGSPEAARSHWVNKEVEWWREHRSRESVLVLLTEGTLEWNDEGADFDWERTDALPPAFRDFFGAEPLWVDLRWAQDAQHVSLRDPRFRERIAELAAPLRDQPKDDLIGEDVREHRRALRLARGAAAMLAVLTAAASVAALVALDQRRQAQAEAKRSESRALAAEARPRFDRQLDLATLLSLEAFELSPTVEARSDVITALQRSERTRTVLRGHSGAVTTVAFSPAGDTLVSGGHDGTIRRWHTASGRPIGPPLRAHRGSVSSLAFSGDGKLLASAGEDDETLKFWDPSTGRPVGAPVKVPDGLPTQISLSPDGRLLAAATLVDARLVDVRTRRVVGESPASAGANIEEVAFSPDGHTVAAGGNRLDLFRVEGRKLHEGAKRRPFSVDAFAFDPNGGVLAVSEFDEIVFREASTGRREGDSLKIPSEQTALAFSPDGTLLASADFGGSLVRLWDVRTRRLRERLRGHVGDATSLAFSPDGETLASGGEDGTIRLWDPTHRRSLGRQLPGARLALSAAISPDGKTLASASGRLGGAVEMWDPRRRRPLGELEGAPGEVFGLAFSRDNETLAAIGDEFAAWDLSEDRPVAEPRVVPGSPYSLALSPDGELAALGGGKGAITLVDPATSRPVGRPLRQRGALSELAFTPDGKSLVSSLDPGPTRVWDVAARKQRGEPLPGEFRAMSDDGATLAVVTSDGTIRLVDLETHRAVGRISTGANQLALDDVDFSPDGRTVAAIENGALRLWDVASARELGEPIQAQLRVRQVEFGGDGQTLVTAGEGPGLMLWDPLLWATDADRFKARLCAIVRRSLTRAEWSEFRPDAPYRRICG